MVRQILGMRRSTSKSTGFAEWSSRLFFVFLVFFVA